MSTWWGEPLQDIIPRWYANSQQLLNDIGLYLFTDIGAVGQTSASAQRYNTFNQTGEGVSPWTSLQDQTSYTNWARIPAWIVFSIICFLIVFCNSFLVSCGCYLQRIDKMNKADVETKLMERALDIDKFKSTYRLILVLLSIFSCLSGLYTIFYLIFGNTTAVTAHLLRNISYIMMLGTAGAFIGFAFVFGIRAFTLARTRAEDAIIHPRALDFAQRALVFVFFWTNITLAPGCGGDPGILWNVSGFLFALLALAPSWAYIIRYNPIKDSHSYFDHWTNIHEENVGYFSVMLIASIFNCLPVTTYVPQRFNLTEDLEPTYYFLNAGFALIPVAVFIFLAAMLISWHCRTGENRNKSRAESINYLNETQTEEDLHRAKYEQFKQSDTARILQPYANAAAKRHGSRSYSSKGTVPTKKSLKAKEDTVAKKTKSKKTSKKTAKEVGSVKKKKKTLL